MAGIKISALPAAPSAQLTDVFPAVQGGVTYKESNSQLATLFGFSGGILALSQGGTSANLTASLGGIVYSGAGALAILSGIATANRVLVSGATAAPTWSTYSIPSSIGATGTILRSNGADYVSSTATFANTYAVSTILYAASANAVSGLATVNRAALSTNATGVPTWLALTDGQIVVGSTAGAPAAATITAGAGISIANASNSITISSLGGGIGWTEVVGTSQAMTADNGYLANNGGLVTLSLPTTMVVGQQVSVIGKGAGGWLISQAAGQQIHLGNTATTLGAGGSLASTNQFDSLTLICTVANTTMTVLGGPQGIITVV